MREGGVGLESEGDVGSGGSPGVREVGGDANFISPQGEDDESVMEQRDLEEPLIFLVLFKGP